MATEKEHYWQFYLRENSLTQDDPNDCVAEIFTAPKTLRNEDIANAIMQEGSEVTYETILSIINKRDRIVRTHILDGHSVITNICQFTPRISGVFASSEAQFNAEVNKLTLDIVLSNSMRDALKTVKTVNLGPKRDVAAIGVVTDTLTGQTDGTITPNEDIRIEGTRIKVAGDDKIAGIFFVAADGTTTQVTRRLTTNAPSEVIARVPALADGEYTLRIVTFYSQSNLLLKTARIIDYKKPLTVGKGNSDDDHPVID